MRDKKILIIITISFFVVVFAVVYFFVINKIAKRGFLTEIKEVVKMSDNVKENKAELEKIECKFTSNKDVIDKAIESGDDNFCNCISEEKEKNNCILKTNDIKIYKQAFTSLKLETCDNIKEEISRKACQSGVKNALDNAKNNPIVEKKDLKIEDYEKIREIDPSNVENLIFLARSYSQRIYTEDEGAVDSAAVDKVFSILNECKKYDVNKAEIYELEGYMWEKKLEYDKSLTSYNKGLELNPDNVNLLVKRSNIYVVLGKKNEAVADLEKVSTLDVSREIKDIYLTLCNIYSSMNNKEKAKKNCEIIINSDVGSVMKDEALKSLELVK